MVDNERIKIIDGHHDDLESLDKKGKNDYSKPINS
jgi:hypothetical protein